MNPKASKIVALSLVGVLAAGAGAWGVLHSGEKKSEETAVASAAVPDEFSIDKLRARAKEDPGGMFDRMRETRDRQDLTEEQRMQIGDNMRTVMEEQMQKRMDEYFNAPEAEKEAILDKQIDEFEKLRKRMEERRQKEETERGAERGPDGKELTEQDREKEREKRMEQWRKREGSKSKAQRKQESESRNPNQMAQRFAYWGAMNKRMQARGIEPPRFGPSGGGPGGPGGRRGG